MKQLRERSGKTAQQVASELGVAQSTINNWDQLKYAPRMTASGFHRLMSVYQCTFEELMDAETAVKAGDSND